MDNNHFVDIPYTKQPDAQEYVEAFDIEGESIDFNILDEYKESNYTLNSANLQNVENAIDVMQSNWQHDIIDGLDDKKNILQSWINNLASSAEEWEPLAEKEYHKNDIVTYSEDPGAYFICLEDCDGTEPINYVKFTNTYNNTDKFDWGLSVNDDVDDENTSFIGESDGGTFTLFKVSYRYDGNYTLRFIKKDTFVGKIDYFIFKGSKEIFEHMNYVVDNSKWLRIYIKGNVGQNSFPFVWRGMWTRNNRYEVHSTTTPGVPVKSDIVWYQIGRDINFYVCVRTINRSEISPDQDTEHWIKLFTRCLDKFIILDEMPNQSYFDDETSPSVFGVVSGSNEIFYYSNLTNDRYDSGVISQLHDGIIIPYVQPIRAYNDAHCIVMCKVFKNGVYIETLNTEFEMDGDSKYNSINIDENTYIELFCLYGMGEGRDSDIWLRINDIYDATDSYEFEVYISHIVSHKNIIKIVDRLNSESALNPQYLKVQSCTSNVYDKYGNDLNTLINRLIIRCNI